MLVSALRQTTSRVQSMAPKINLDYLDMGRGPVPTPQLRIAPAPQKPRSKLMVDCENLLPNIPIAKLCWDPEKQWHKEVVPSIRIHLVKKMLKALLAHRPFSVVEDKNLLETYLCMATTLEGSNFTTASSRLHYYNLIANEIYRIYQTKKSMQEQTQTFATLSVACDRFEVPKVPDA